MRVALVAYGLLLLVVGVLGVVRPAALIGFVERLWRSPVGLYLAVLVRAAIGVLLLGAASSTRFPGIIQALGILALVAAVPRLIVGYGRWRTLIEWWAARRGFVRGWSLVPVLFGAFLIYAAV